MSINFETIILRFRDLVTTENETIAKHTAVIDKYGYVWWAWWKKGNEQTPRDEFASLSIQTKESPVDVFLIDSGQSLVYRATCEDVELRTSCRILSPDKDKTPEYYRDQEYYAWFKFTKIEPCDGKELMQFSYVDCKSLFIDKNVNYSKFNNKKIYSIEELIQQNRTVWFVRKAKETDFDNEIVLLDSDFVQPTDFSTKYYQASGNTLIWLSDLHLPDHAFEPEMGKIHLTLAQHLHRFIGERKVGGLLISGDITSCAKDEGFQEAQQLLQDISREIPLNSENILICPGNHDFVRDPVDLPRGKEPEFIYNKKENAEGFTRLYHSIYNLNPNQYFASGKKLFLSSGHILEIAALNSVLLQQYPNFDGHGYLSQEQLDYVAEQMGWNSSENQNAIRIVIMHHHYLPACYTEVINPTRASSAVYDADRLMNWLVKHNVKLLLHGHKHNSFVSQISYPVTPEKDISIKDMRHIAVIGMGSTGASGVENKFAMIHFCNNEVIIEFCRIYSDESMADNICQTIRFFIGE